VPDRPVVVGIEARCRCGNGYPYLHTPVRGFEGQSKAEKTPGERAHYRRMTLSNRPIAPMIFVRPRRQRRRVGVRVSWTSQSPFFAESLVPGPHLIMPYENLLTPPSELFIITHLIRAEFDGG